ncbi:hypothetical protein M413DRAFT_255944 [Hebeloma cylindrosporum]|uniref:Uncharacterized protein n=1 Tax=Hebeloma cylindrosporum TaxID=76867 RepID=A0A0C3BM58_HEBCY|nr:hypothetical protein M413DRAFT_255944 [Hebeloma cylindrosporum h7]
MAAKKIQGGLQSFQAVQVNLRLQIVLRRRRCSTSSMELGATSVFSEPSRKGSSMGRRRGIVRRHAQPSEGAIQRATSLSLRSNKIYRFVANNEHARA